ncbi:MAG TPA: YceI family protein [Gemmatimonadaceae bacterium]|nr:YceI family protein [Gemmatimonadaceae bacterium]
MRSPLLLLASSAALLLAAPELRAQAPTWKIDPVHSELTFRIRHYVTKVRGTFGKWEGTVTADPAALNRGSVEVSIEANSIDTNNEMRDRDLRSSNFFAADSFPTIAFKSRRVEVSGDAMRVFGDLTIRGTTKPVVLNGSYSGVAKDAQGKERIGFEASTRINRMDYRVSWNRAIEGGGVMLGDEVEINITVEAVKQ